MFVISDLKSTKFDYLARPCACESANTPRASSCGVDPTLHGGRPDSAASLHAYVAVSDMILRVVIRRVETASQIGPSWTAQCVPFLFPSPTKIEI
jgi:hypothetical protein